MTGKTISHYRILEKLGEGGMGVVYKAEDTKLKRTVALKFLSSNLVGDGEEKKRFLREAQAAAALNHPNIATIHEIDEADGQLFIAMEFIEGKSLADIVGAQHAVPLPLEDAIDYATQTAAGLQAAHEKGITHRDIKSANIMVTDKGQIKIMDFGLAKLANRSKMTQLGATLGTAAYMSPEQSRGENTDHRSDIWSLGVVLYEMISGQMPFKGDYEQAVIYSIQNEEPEPLTALRSGLPIALDGIIAKALAKDASTRYQNVEEMPADLKALDKIFTSKSRISINPAHSGIEEKSALKTRTWLLVSLVLLVASLFANLTWIFKSPANELPFRKSKFTIDGTTDIFRANAAISPNGEVIAFIQDGSLWIRDLKQLEARLIPGTDGASRIFWSPSSEYVGYLNGGQRRFERVSVQSGAIKTITDYNFAEGHGAAWRQDGRIVFGAESGLFEASETGGEARLVAKSDSAKNEALIGSTLFLPDGTLLVLQVYGDGPQQLMKVTGSTKRMIPGMPHTTLGALVNLVYSGTGHLLYNTHSGLWAVPFSFSDTRITGKPLLIEPNGIGPSVSSTNTLVYTRNASPGDRLVIVNRQGVVIDTVGQIQESIWDPAVSPDGWLIAVSGFDKGNRDIWIHDRKRNNMERVTSHPSWDRTPAWTPDGMDLIFESRRKGDGALFKKRTDGSGQAAHISTGPFWSYEPTLSRAGDYLVYTTVTIGQKSAPSELWYRPLEESGQPEEFLNDGGRIFAPELSPDGKYLAYHSNESGEFQVYVIQFPEKRFRSKVSISGGQFPIWNATGDELFYCGNKALMAVKIDADADFRVIGGPKMLFTEEKLQTQFIAETYHRAYDVMPDGEHFVIVQPVGKRESEIVVVQNWFKEFEKEE